MFSNRVPIGVGFGLLAAVLLTQGCTASKHEPEERYFLVGSNIKIAYWQKAGSGLSAAANEMRIRADFVGPDKYDPKEQQEMFRRAVSQKPSGIMVSAADQNLMKDDINSAIAAGIPVITMDSDAPSSNRLFFVGTNNYQAGFMGGKRLVEKLGGKGNVVVFTIPAQANLADRMRGYEDAFTGTGIKIVQTVDVHGDPATAFDKTMEITDKAKVSVDAFVCLDSTAGSEVAEVLSRKKMTGKLIMAFDANDQTLDWIDKGVIAATIGQKPYTMAYYGLHLLDDLHHNKPQPLDAKWGDNLEAKIPAAVDTGSTLIDKSNLSLIRQPGGAAAK